VSDVLDAAATWEAMRSGVVAFRAARDVVAVRGPDARSWLQGQLSQDLSALVEGESVDALVLAPEGRLVALVRVTGVGDEELLLDTDAGAGADLVERLRRFRLRVKAEVELLDWRCVALRGPASGAHAAGDAVRAAWRWPGDEGVDLLAADPQVPSGVPLGDPGAAEAARIAAGVPRHGRELDGRTIPHEAGVVERTVSFTKGCYTGQELVARLDARGARVPKRLRGIVSGSALSTGDEVRAGGRVVATLTSTAVSPATGASLALAYVRREVEAPADGETDAGACRIVPLPMLDQAPVSGS
jgi:folate-binding protein YgfZ